MPLSPRTRLGPYEIVSSIGAGGMGEVYCAHDTKLGRDVAIKVLPDAFAKDVERMARFEREAQVLASLNHPNIATIHGLEESNNIRGLVMELVEGPTLAERTVKGAIPLEEALAIAKQIAEGLEYAHEKGIIHRDLKPANIRLTGAGQVKLLDFGLAKALDKPVAAGNPSISPTLTLDSTRAGIILGTAAYMAPEQARGAVVDKRADIWAYGVVLYEMLTGKRAVRGRNRFRHPCCSVEDGAGVGCGTGWHAAACAALPGEERQAAIAGYWRRADGGRRTTGWRGRQPGHCGATRSDACFAVDCSGNSDNHFAATRRGSLARDAADDPAAHVADRGTWAGVCHGWLRRS